MFSSRRRHTRLQGDWSSDVCSSDLRTGAWAKIVGTNKRNLSSTDVRVFVKWAGGDTRLQVLTSGFRYYQVQRRINEIGRASCRERASLPEIDILVRNATGHGTSTPT